MSNSGSQIGTIVSLNHPEISSLLTGMGFDFIFIDLEHGHVNDETIASIVISKKSPCKIFIRIQAVTESCIKHALDLGADGIVAPRVEHLHEIESLIQYAYYPPIGKRSVGFSLANRYGLEFKHYTENFRPLLLPQIESKEGLALADDMLANEYIDGIFVGPYDLSMSMGVAGQFDTPVFKSAYDCLRELCKSRSKLFCTFCSGTEQARQEILQKTDMIAVGVDGNIILKSYENMINKLKQA